MFKPIFLNNFKFEFLQVSPGVLSVLLFALTINIFCLAEKLSKLDENE